MAPPTELLGSHSVTEGNPAGFSSTAEYLAWLDAYLSGETTPVGTTATVSTNQADYAPGATATITATGFATGTTVTFGLADLPSDPGDDPGDPDVYGTFTLADGGPGDLDGLANGTVVTSWLVPTDNDGSGSGIPDALNATVLLAASGSDGQVATTTFTDANPAPLQIYYNPLPEGDVRDFFDLLQPAALVDGVLTEVSDTLVSITSITLNQDGTLIYWDQGEDGYELDIANPTNIYSSTNLGGTQIWGDNNPNNGIAPGFVVDVLGAGDTIILDNIVDAVNPGNNPANTYNGGDKFAATDFIGVQRLIWPTATYNANGFEGSTVLAGAVEVVDTFEYGTVYTAPVGQNSDSRGGNSVFEEVTAFILAKENETQVFLDGVLKGTIDEGETLVIADIQEGDQITSTDGKPVEALLLTGDFKGNWESRWYRLTADQGIGNDYYSPVTVKTGGGSARQIEYFVHNQTDSEITVNWQGSGASSGSFTVGAEETEVINTSALPTGGGPVPLPTNSAIRFFTNDSKDIFSVLAAVDVPTNNSNGSNYDWGFTLLERDELSSRLQAGFAFGSANPDGTLGSGNGGPIWVTALEATTITVDWDGDLDTTGDQQNVNVNALESVQLYDTVNNDNDQSGALVFAEDGTLITGAYGADPSTSTIFDPFIDLGYTIRSLPALKITKFTDDANGVKQDANEPTGPLLNVGDIATFTYEVENNGGSSLTNVEVIDDQGVEVTFTGGDDNNDGILQNTETWIYTASTTVTPGQYTNIGTVTATTLLGEPVAPDADPSNHFGVAIPGIDIEKSTNGEDADTATGPVLLVGDTANFEYVVTNAGDVALGNVTVSDDQGVALTFTGGDTDGDGLLDTTEIWTYTASTTVTAGQYTNIGTAIGTPVDENGNPLVDPDGNPLPDASESDPSNHFGADPGIAIDKVTNGSDGPTVLAGSPITWTYTVSNTGNVDIANVVVTDDQGVTPVFQSGDTNNDTILQTTETWIYTANGTAIAGAYTNLGTVTGDPQDPNGDPVGPPVEDDDPSNYVGEATPGIDIEKATNGQDADDPTGPLLNIGDTATFTYVVTNTGDVALGTITVTDDQAVTPVFQGGDSDNDGLLDLDETWTYTASIVVTTPGQYTNIGTASGTPVDEDGNPLTDPDGNPLPAASDTDPSNHFVVAIPGIDIEKSTNGQDADDPTGPLLNIGDTATFTYVVTNTGDVALGTITVTDDQAVTPVFQGGDSDNDGLLDLDETWTYTASIVVTTPGQYTNIGTASGTPVDEDGNPLTDPDGNPLPAASDTDPSNHFVVAIPGIDIEKSTNGQDADDPTGPLLNIGDTATFTYVVTNTGDVALGTITVTDDQAVTPVFQGGDSDNDGLLDLDETWTYTASIVVTTPGQYTNIGTASGTPVDEDGNPLTDPDGNPLPAASDTDPSNHFVVAIPGIDIEKATNGQDADDPTGPLLNIGDTATFTYVVTNTGDVALGTITVTDDQAVTPVFQGGDSDNDGLLDLDETWTYTASIVVTTPGQYTNIGTASGTPVDEDGNPLTDPDGNPLPAASDTDPSNHFVVAIPGIDIEKSTNGQDADDPTGPLLNIGDTATFTYVVTNTGDVALGTITVTDDQAVTPVFQGGDSDNDGLLDLDETWTYTASIVVTTPGQYTNIGTASGTPVDEDGNPLTDPDGNPLPAASDTDPSNHFVVAIPGIDIEKATNGQDADDPTGPLLNIGDTATFTYVVTNTGDVALGTITVTDDQAVTPVFQGGDSDNDGLLDLDETWTYTASIVVTTPGQYTNIGTASGTPVDEDGNPLTDPDGNPLPAASDTDPSNHFVVAIPGIDIEKSTNGQDADDPTGPLLNIGDTATFTYVVTNTGDVALGTITVTDDQAVTPVFQGGDSDNDGLLDLDETWTYTASIVVTTPGQYTNIGTASGTPVDEDGNPLTDPDGNPLPAASDTDPSNHFVVAIPGIDIEKSTNGQDADDPTGPLLNIGDTATFTYVVTNTGDVALGTITVTDDQAVTPVFQGGDSDNDGLLDLDETWTYTASIVVTTPGQYTNIGTASGTPVDEDGNPLTDPDGNPLPAASDTDPSNHFVVAIPGIDIEKSTNGQDADDPTGPLLNIGDTATFTYVVTNTGDVALGTITVTDDQAVTPVFQGGDSDNDGLLDLDETWTYTASIVVTTPGQYTNIGTASGTPVDEDGNPLTDPDGNPLPAASDTDPSNHFVVAIPGIDIEKSTNGEDADDPTGPLLNIGDTATFTYVVTNTGDVALGTITVTDDQAVTPVFQGGDSDNDGLLDLDETWTYTASIVVTTPGQYTNIGTASGTPVDEDGNPLTDPDGNPLPAASDTDPSNHFVVAIPEINLQKFVRLDANPLDIRKLVAVELIDPSMEGEDLCMTAGKPEAMVFIYEPSNTFNPLQPVPNKANIIVNNGIDDDDIAYVIVSDKSSDPLSGKVYFQGNVNKGDSFTASIANASSSFASNTYIYFYDDQGGPLLQQVQYHTSCSAPIILGAEALSATLVGYDGENGGLITLPLPSFEDANEAPGPSTMVGTTVNFRYEVTNTGDTPISNVALTDNKLTPSAVVAADEDGNEFNIGDTNQDDLLDPDEKWLFEGSEEAAAGLNTNLGTVTGININGNTVIAMDPANYTAVDGPPVGSDCPTGPIGGIDLGDLTKYLFFFANGSSDANWQGATKGFAGDVVVNGSLANERTSGSVPFAGTIYTNDSSLGAWQKIIDQNPGQATAVTGQTQLVQDLEADLMSAFGQINALAATAGFTGRSATSLNGLNTQNGVDETFVINITSGLQVSSVINITGDAGDVYVLRWDSDLSKAGYQGQAKFQSGGGINPLGGLTAGNFIHVAGDINASGGGSNLSGLPQGPIDETTGQLINGGSNFSGGGFFTGYWLTTGDPSSKDTASLSNAIFTGGWYTLSDKFSMTSGTSGVHVCPNPATLPTEPIPPVEPPPAHGSSMDLVIQPQVDAVFDPDNIGVEADTPTGPIAQLDDIITFTYKVINPGSVDLEITSLVDDNATPDDLSDDFEPTAVLQSNGNNVGDANNDGFLNPDETWYYQAKILAEKGGQQTNIAKVVAETDDGTMVMTDDPGNYLINPLQLQKLVAVEPIDPGMEGEDLCMTAGKPEAMVFRYDPSNDFNPLQPVPNKANIIVNNGLDDDNTAYVIVSDKSSDPLSGKVYFEGNVNIGDDFTASIASAGSSFASNTYIYFYDNQGGPLLQQVQYHTSCSAPIILGAEALSATLVGYDGENGGLVTLPDPVYEDANTAPGPEAIIGSTVQFKYIVSNTGDEILSNVDLTDDKIASLTLVENGNGDEFLDPGEAWIYTGSETAKEGVQTNKATATADLGSTELMAMDPANYTGIKNPPPSGDICDLFGKPTALYFDYEPSTDVITGQDSGKAKVLFTNPLNGGVDDDGTSFIVVTDEEDAAKALAGNGDQYFRGMVDVGSIFIADDTIDSFGSTTVIHFFDNENGGLLQSVEYHTSCSQPIQIGDVIGNGTLVGYQGEDGGFIPF